MALLIVFAYKAFLPDGDAPPDGVLMPAAKFFDASLILRCLTLNVLTFSLPFNYKNSSILETISKR
jgi:hypothetical protein